MQYETVVTLYGWLRAMCVLLIYTVLAKKSDCNLVV